MACSTAIDALIVGIETQARYLTSKKTWTRKIVLVTDGESPIEVEDWEATVAKMDALDISLTLMFVLLLTIVSASDVDLFMIVVSILTMKNCPTLNLTKEPSK